MNYSTAIKKRNKLITSCNLQLIQSNNFSVDSNEVMRSKRNAKKLMFFAIICLLSLNNSPSAKKKLLNLYKSEK